LSYAGGRGIEAPHPEKKGGGKKVPPKKDEGRKGAGLYEKRGSAFY